MAVIGVGLDLVDIDRAGRLLSRHGERILERLLTAAEADYVRSRPSGAARHFAARLAAKEAVYKAMQVLPGARSVGWREIEVVSGPDRRPGIRLHGKARVLLATRPGVRLHLSLSHSDATAGAVVVVEHSV